MRTIATILLVALMLTCVTCQCGNGMKEGTETCDDGNVLSGDGCSGACQTEVGCVCTGDKPTRCDCGSNTNTLLYIVLGSGVCCLLIAIVAVIVIVNTSSPTIDDPFYRSLFRKKKSGASTPVVQEVDPPLGSPNSFPCKSPVATILCGSPAAEPLRPKETSSELLKTLERLDRGTGSPKIRSSPQVKDEMKIA